MVELDVVAENVGSDGVHDRRFWFIASDESSASTLMWERKIEPSQHPLLPEELLRGFAA
jgi:hypothetical protein